MIFDKSHFSLHKTLAINPEFMWLQFLMLRAVENIRDWVQDLDFCFIQLHHSIFFGSKTPMSVSQFWSQRHLGLNNSFWAVLCTVGSLSIPSLYSLSDRSTIPAVTTQKYLQILPNITLLLREPLFFLSYFMTCRNLSSPARDRTYSPCFGNTES